MPAAALPDVSVIGGIPVLGIVIALIGGVFLALGAQFQHRGVAKVEARHGSGRKNGLGIRQLLRLLGRPSWVLGTVLLGLAIICQLTSLGFAPIIVVQPLGVIALVITSIVNSRVSRVRLSRRSIRAIVFCVGGIAVFVSVAAFVATEHPVRQGQLVAILVIVAVVLALLVAVFVLFRRRAGAVFYIISAGVLYGFVATLAKTVINSLGNAIAGIAAGSFDWLTIVAVVLLLAAGALGAYFVQTAYSVGAPDLVIAGLTVVDPIVAVTIGIVVLGEASGAPVWALPLWIASAGIAVYGVFQLARYHPQTAR